MVMTTATSTHASIEREQVLKRQLSTGQQTMLALGGAIGTGLFLSSGAAAATAGPAVVLAYVLMAVVAIWLGAALTEMCVAHPTAGSFGLYAGIYVSPFAGYLVRQTYWLMQVTATAGHMAAISTYMRFWFPAIPGPLWIVVFSLAILYVNARAVGEFGEFEYWFAMIKVAAVALFVPLALATLFGWVGDEAPGLTNYVAHGGFFPKGIVGVWLACSFAFYSFVGVEVVAVASGEAAQPEKTIPPAMRRMVVSLSLIYVVTLLVLVGILPWNQAGVTESPFVSVLGKSGIAFAAGIMNLVVLSAALSGANANLYLVSRTLFSLSRSGFMPKAVGAVNARGAPINALLMAAVGLGSAVVVQAIWPDSAYLFFVGISLFGAYLVWFMIFVTHLLFRRVWERPGAAALSYRSPWGRGASWAGALVVLGLLVSSPWIPGLPSTFGVAPYWMGVMILGYWLTRKKAGAAG